MRRLTVDEVMALKPCYSRERVEELWAGRDSLGLDEIAALDIPRADRLWCLLAPRVLPKLALGELHCRIVDEAVEIYERYYPDDPRPRHANDVHRAMLRGEATAGEWAAARNASWAAAEAAARDAARSASWDAARAAARAAAWTAARAASWAAARDAARNAAWDAARAAARAAARDAAWADAWAAAIDRYISWAVEAGAAL